MIDVLAVDRWSGRTHGWLHRASAPAKIVAAGACISVLITSRDVATLALVYAGLLAALVTSGLPVRPLLALSGIPLLMSAAFAITRLGGTWESAIAIVEKGAITSLVVLLLIASTPAIDLFRVIRRIMPRTLAEILFLGYRSIFILVGRAFAAREALRLRSARLALPVQLRRNALVGALAVLRASELAADQYAAMRLRGLGDGRDLDGPRWRGAGDAPILGAVTLLLISAFAVGRTADLERWWLLGVGTVALGILTGVSWWRARS